MSKDTFVLNFEMRNAHEAVLSSSYLWCAICQLSHVLGKTDLISISGHTQVLVLIKSDGASPLRKIERSGATLTFVLIEPRSSPSRSSFWVPASRPHGFRQHRELSGQTTSGKLLP